MNKISAPNKHLFLLTILVACNLTLRAQTVKFEDLVYFTSLTNREVYDNLLQGNAFRQEYSMDVNGQDTEYFKSIGNKPSSEKIIVGNFTRLYNGTILRTVKYTSADPQNILNMVTQAKRYGLEMNFHGVDATDNIYLFDNSFYHVSIYLKRNQSSGLVEIKQKEYVDVN